MIKICILVLFAVLFCTECSRTTTKTSTTKTAKTTKKNPYAEACDISHSFSILKIADGDTATVKNASDNGLVRIRFKCIDAPEKSQPKWGAESLKKLSYLLPSKTDVKLRGCQRDPYNRTVAEVINNKGVNINLKMVELGYVVVYPFQKGCDDYLNAEKIAKSKKLGVYGDPKFELPWKYRERMGIGYRGQKNHTRLFL